MPEMQAVIHPETQAGNLSVIGAWLIRSGFSYDDRRRILSLFSSHASVAKEAVKEILGGISDARAAFGRYLSRLLP
jgi:hypothetical protein